MNGKHISAPRCRVEGEAPIVTRGRCVRRWAVGHKWALCRSILKSRFRGIAGMRGTRMGRITRSRFRDRWRRDHDSEFCTWPLASSIWRLCVTTRPDLLFLFLNDAIVASSCVYSLNWLHSWGRILWKSLGLCKSVRGGLVVLIRDIPLSDSMKRSYLWSLWTRPIPSSIEV